MAYARNQSQIAIIKLFLAQQASETLIEPSTRITRRFIPFKPLVNLDVHCLKLKKWTVYISIEKHSLNYAHYRYCLK